MGPDARLKCHFCSGAYGHWTAHIGEFDSACEVRYEFGQGKHRPLSRLLLGHAVQGAEAEDQIARSDANHFAIGE